MSESFFEFDESIGLGAIIRIIGVGKGGIRTVGKMSGRINNVDCLGIDFVTRKTIETASFPIIYVEEPQKGHSLELAVPIKSIEASDLVFIVAFPDEELNYLPEDICRAIKQKSIPLIIVVPETHLDNTASTEYWEQVKEFYEIADAIIFVSNRSLQPLDSEAPKVFDDADLMELLIRHSIEKITNLITYRSLMCIDFADVFSIFQQGGMARVGIGISAGESKGTSATAKAIAALEQQGVSCDSEGLRVLCSINGSSNMTTADYNEVNCLIHKTVDNSTNVKIGIIVQDELGDNLMVTIWVVGVRAIQS